MSSTNKMDKSKQVKAVAAKTTTASSKDAKTSVKSITKPQETKEEEKKNLKKKYEDDENDNDSVCILDSGQTRITYIFGVKCNRSHYHIHKMKLSCR